MDDQYYQVKNSEDREALRFHGGGLSVIVPAYNEEHGIGLVLDQVFQVLSESGLQFEIIIVDDGSQDQTATIANEIGFARVIRHGFNRGYGAAIKTGIRQAQNELICITDADGTYPNERIPDLLAAIVDGEYDMVVGARVGKNVSIPLLRRPAKWMIAKLAYIVTGEVIPDINSGLRVFKRSVAMRFFNLLPDGFSLTTTFTLGLLVNGYSIEYLPIEYFPRLGKSKIRPIQDTLNFIQLVLRIALYFSPLKIFLPIGGFLFILGILWGWISWYLFGRVADASMMAIIMASIQVSVVGLLADLINHRLAGYQKPED
jgi:glycosyltransferase involved in cell wall biosynthesis